jgi:hypothetical protein
MATENIPDEIPFTPLVPPLAPNPASCNISLQIWLPPRLERRWRHKWHRMARELDPKTRQEIEELIQARENAAYAKGYADAIAAKIGGQFSGVSAVASAGEIRGAKTAGDSRADKSQLPRGIAINMVEEYLASIAPRAVAQIEMIRNIKMNTKVRLPTTTLRRAIDALTDSGVVEQVKGTKAWRYIGNRAAHIRPVT